MQSLLHQLENNEAILLVYLADELSAEDRAEVEQMLGSDAGLRAERDRLHGLRDDTVTALARLDAGARLPVSEGVAVRRATRMMRQWQVDQAHAPPPDAPLNELRFPWWSYPLTTAATVLIAFLVWWGNLSERPQPVVQRYSDPVPEGPQDLDGWHAEAITEDLIETFTLSEDELIQMAMNQRTDETVHRLTTGLPSLVPPEPAAEGL